MPQLADAGREERRAGLRRRPPRSRAGMSPASRRALYRACSASACSTDQPRRRSGTTASRIETRYGSGREPCTVARHRSRARSSGRAPGRPGRSCGPGSAGSRARTTPARPGTAWTTRTRRSRRGCSAPAARPRPASGCAVLSERVASFDHRPALEREQVPKVRCGQLGDPALAAADDLRGQARACRGSSRRSSPRPCRRRRTCGPARCGAGRSGTRGRWPGPRRPGSTSGRRARRGWPRSGSGRYRRP